VHEHVRELMAEKLGVNVIDKTIEVLKELDKLEKNVQELMGDKEFTSFVESIYLKADERTVRKTIFDITFYLKTYSMLYRPYIEEV
jgi:alpha-N-acetylglucosamine transferase